MKPVSEPTKKEIREFKKDAERMWCNPTPQTTVKGEVEERDNYAIELRLFVQRLIKMAKEQIVVGRNYGWTQDSMAQELDMFINNRERVIRNKAISLFTVWMKKNLDKSEMEFVVMEQVAWFINSLSDNEKEVE